MKVKLLVSRAGPGLSQIAGEEIEVSEAEAKSLIKAGQAEPIAKRETATKKKTAIKRASK